ncbi:hypothetical protein GCM10028809_14660 [Spirosoma gilvum]
MGSEVDIDLQKVVVLVLLAVTNVIVGSQQQFPGAIKATSLNSELAGKPCMSKVCFESIR